MVQIKRAFNPQSPKTPRETTGNPKSGSFHDPSQLTRTTVKSKTSVTRKHATRAGDDAYWDPVMNQFTNNANPRYDPSKAPGSVTIKDGTPPPPKGATTGHQKVIPYNNQQRTGGKTLKRI